MCIEEGQNLRICSSVLGDIYLFAFSVLSARPSRCASAKLRRTF